MQENEKMAFEFASDLTKQLITLSAAIVTFTITFSKDIMEGTGMLNLSLLAWSWGIHLASIIFGILTLMALTGNLETIPLSTPTSSVPPVPAAPPQIFSIKSSNVVSTSRIQVLTFVIAIILTVIYVIPSKKIKENYKDSFPITRKIQLGTDSKIYIDTIYVPRNMEDISKK